MRIKTSNDSIINVDSVKHSITIEGVEFGSDCSAFHLYERGGYPSIKQIEMIAKTYDVNPGWLVGWVDDEMQPAIQVVEKTIYKESPTARLPDYFNNNNDGKIIKWVKTKRYMGGKVWAKRT